ncbi:MAG: hypothetical protein HYT97_01970 [Elusimicrobia bacterium]|nr:hypothetical protein [Elusimicrobiota bacterium]
MVNKSGKIKKMVDNQFPLDNRKPKVIGKMIHEPSNGKHPYSNKNLATIVKDHIVFHGTHLNISVHHSYKSKLINNDITVASGREIRMKERGITFNHDGYLASIELPRDRTQNKKERIYGAFLNELPKKAMKYFPILLNYSHTRKGLKLVEVKVFLPRS